MNNFSCFDNLEACIFDLDGTIVNSLEDLADSTNKVLEKHGYLAYPVHTYTTFIGDGIDVLLQRAFKSEDTAFLTIVRSEFDSIYQKQCLHKTKPYSGIISLLMELQEQGIKMAVVTNKAHAIANHIVTQVFPHMFLYTYGNSKDYPRKPDATIVNKVIEEMGSNKEECVFIGDSDIDILTGKNAGMKTIGVVWGFRGKEELQNSGADAIADTPKDIRRIIDDWRK
jgi:phosphoglycolate phosphatase